MRRDAISGLVSDARFRLAILPWQFWANIPCKINPYTFKTPKEYRFLGKWAIPSLSPWPLSERL